MNAFGPGEVVNVQAGGPFGFPIGKVEALMCAVITLVVLRLEFQRRARTGPYIGSMRSYAQSCKRLFQDFAPEACTLTACLTLAGALRAWHSSDASVSEEDAVAWEQIKAQWPLLLTADTLLSLQAMLRLVLLLSLVLRAAPDTSGPMPLSEEASAFWLLANTARFALQARSSMYKLDGPLGGSLPAACELAALPILLVLSRGAMRRAGMTLVLVTAVAATLASRNYLSLAGDNIADSLFVLAHCLDFLAAFTYVFRTTLLERGTRDVSVGFTHLLMPVQQGLAAYYFLQAFEESPELVGAGVPFIILQIGNTAAFGAYLGASVLHFADGSDARGRDQVMI